MNRELARLTVLLTLLAVPFVACADDDKSPIDPASWAPMDCLFYFGITDIDEAWQGFEKTASYRMFNDPAMKDVEGVNIFAPVFKEFKERLAKALDVPAEQIKNPFKGPVAVYVTAPPGGDANSITPGLVAGVGDRAVLRQYYDNAVKRLKAVAKYESVEAGGQTIDVFKTEPGSADPNSAVGDAPESFDPALAATDPARFAAGMMDKVFSSDSLPPAMAMCLTDDRLVVSDSADAVKAILRRDGGGRTLADADDFKAIARHLKPAGNIQFLINLPRLLQMARAAQEGEDAESFAKWTRALGGEGLGSVIGHIRFGASNYDAKYEMLFLMTGERAGLAKILSMENRPIAPPASVSTDAALVASLNLNVPNLLDEIERMVRQNDPESADSMRRGLEEFPFIDPQKPMNLRKEVLDHLVGPLLVHMSITKPVGPGCARFLIAMGHKDQQALVRFLSAFQGMLMPRDAGGTQAFDLALMPGMSIMPTNDQLLAGSVAAIESATKPTSGESLAESDNWRRAARFVPEQAWLTLYFDNRRMLETAFELARKQDELQKGPPDPGVMMLLTMTEGVNTDDPATVRRLVGYAAPSIVTVATTPEGVRVTGVTLRASED